MYVSLTGKSARHYSRTYKEIEALWEILSPSEDLRDYVALYKQLVQLYVTVRNAYAKTAYSADLAKKTSRMVQERTTQMGLSSLIKTVTFDTDTLECIRNEKGTDEGKVLNLVRGLRTETNNAPDMAPAFRPLKDRARDHTEKYGGT